MTLSPLDDLPVHQVAEPVRHVATSDRNFYDRYYFNGHPFSDELFFVFGMGQYPNLGVQDAFLAVLYDGRHRVVRAARPLGADRTDTTVGPLRVEVLEGLRRLRIVCEPGDETPGSGQGEGDQRDGDERDGDAPAISADLTWHGAVPPHREPQHVIRRHGRVVFDSARLAQTGSWEGRLSVTGREFDVTPDRWWGTRDRSWGIRPVGEAEPPGIAAGDVPGFWWLYSPMRFDDHSLYVIVQEEPDGRRVLESAVRSWPFEVGKEPEHLGRPEYDLEFEPGTRTVRRAVLRAGDAEVTVTPVLPMHVGVGTGYGLDADWRHGMWQGPETVVQSVSWDLRTDEGRAAMWGIVDSVARCERADGAVGWGLFEYLFLGPHQRHGWTGFDDAG